MMSSGAIPNFSVRIFTDRLATASLRSRVNACLLYTSLEERFGLELHRESRIVSGYELVVAKGGSKLEPAQAEDDLTPLDPEERKKRVRGLMNERGTEASDGKSAYRFVEFLRRQLDHAGVRG